ncbi:MAG TPA: AI-2E family transporter [Chloroflexia bacterium]|nr:AI-2E family transporter [Chloroflexia bacterium]
MQQNNRWVQTLVVLLVIIASAWLIGQVWNFLGAFSNIFYIFFVAWLLAFILRPLAKWLANRGMPYSLAIGVVYLLLGLVLTLGLWLLIPEISKQVEKFVGSMTEEIAALTSDNEAARLNSFWGIPRLLNDWFSQDQLNQFYGELAKFAQQTSLDLVRGTAAFAQGLAVFFFQLILVLLLSFYFMKDGERISAGITNLLPPRWQDEIRLIAYSIERSFGGFIRGQVVFALVYAILTAIVMVIPPFSLGNFALVASIAAGMFMLIPLIGNLLAFIPPMLALLFTPDKVSLWWIFFLILFIMQSIMMNVLAPRIMSSAIGIHPMYVWAAILIGGQVAGIWGALFGIPIAGAMNLIGRPVLRRLRHTTSLYKEVPASAVPTSAYLTGPLAAAMAEGRIPPDSIPPGILDDTVTPSAPANEPPSVPPSQVARSLTSTGALATSMLPTLPDDDEDEVLVRPSPTLTAKAWRLAFVMLSRARKGAWEKVQSRRQP